MQSGYQVVAYYLFSTYLVSKFYMYHVTEYYGEMQVEQGFSFFANRIQGTLIPENWVLGAGSATIFSFIWPCTVFKKNVCMDSE